MSTLERDRPRYTTVGICDSCRHRRDATTCAAFPRGIPVAILTGDADHRKPYPGDHGIRYEPVEDEGAR